MEMTRSFMTLYHNHNMVMGKGSTPKSRQDWFRLSYDEKEVEEIIDPDILQKKIEVLESVIKKKKQRG